MPAASPGRTTSSASSRLRRSADSSRAAISSIERLPYRETRRGKSRASAKQPLSGCSVFVTPICNSARNGFRLRRRRWRRLHQYRAQRQRTNSGSRCRARTSPATSASTSAPASPPTRPRAGSSSTGRTRSSPPQGEPRWRAFVRQYRDPMQIVLLVAGIGSIWPLHELGTGLVLLFLTLFNAVLGLNQEGKAAAAVAALQKMMIIKARVRRERRAHPDPGRAARPRRRRRRSRPETSCRRTAGSCRRRRSRSPSRR